MGLLHHLALTASDLAVSARFYDGLLTHFGYCRVLDTPSLAAWEGPDFELLLYQARELLRSRRHELYQPGFHHLALRAAERQLVDQVHRWLVAAGAAVLDPPRLYPHYAPDYYAVFFTDPDDLKLEVMHTPSGEAGSGAM